MPRKLFRRLIDRRVGNDWERLLRRSRRRNVRRFVLLWNRGLGDIALGLCQVIDELRADLPDAAITIVTRADLAEAFQLLPVDRVIVDADMRRDRRDATDVVLRRVGIDRSDHDVVVSRIDPTRWFLHKPRAQPCLHWPRGLDALAHRFDPHFVDGRRSVVYVAVHAQCETSRFYSYGKDWPAASWMALFERLRTNGDIRFVLFGHRSDVRFDDPACIDLRGRTSFLEMMAIIKRHCSIMIGPDSGILTMTYYLGDQFPIGLVSLWADPRQGILKQGVPSPNRLLRHTPVLGDDERVERIGVDAVTEAFDAMLARLQRVDDVATRGDAA